MGASFHGGHDPSIQHCYGTHRVRTVREAVRKSPHEADAREQRHRSVSTTRRRRTGEEGRRGVAEPDLRGRGGKRCQRQRQMRGRQAYHRDRRRDARAHPRPRRNRRPDGGVHAVPSDAVRRRQLLRGLPEPVRDTGRPVPRSDEVGPQPRSHAIAGGRRHGPLPHVAGLREGGSRGTSSELQGRDRARARSDRSVRAQGPSPGSDRERGEASRNSERSGVPQGILRDRALELQVDLSRIPGMVQRRAVRAVSAEPVGAVGEDGAAGRRTGAVPRRRAGVDARRRFAVGAGVGHGRLPVARRPFVERPEGGDRPPRRHPAQIGNGTDIRQRSELLPDDGPRGGGELGHLPPQGLARGGDDDDSHRGYPRRYAVPDRCRRRRGAGMAAPHQLSGQR
mmetsp:Transcript_28057/g.52240  ORF Transcript_28057/g.52240 Transcript_28057/m.52240 type:complete len:395 (-) Transcript_28057:442-1626(-)